MLALGIDTSGIVASVAIANEDKVLGEFTTNYKRTHSVTLMPMIRDILNALDVDKQALDVIAVSSGPGSFTGLRIGSATAKSMAHVLKKPIASVPTLEVLANNISYSDAVICPLIDARRDEVYYAEYAYDRDILKATSSMQVDSIEKVIRRFRQTGEKAIFLGDGASVHEERLKNHLQQQCFITPINNRMQKAGTVAMLGLKYLAENKLETYLNHKPLYLRKSQAEQEYEKRQQLEEKAIDSRES